MNENENIEFKRELTDTIVKEIIAFCNTNGGTIFIGYNDDGSVKGLDDAKSDMDKLSSKINDLIEPSVNYLVSSEIKCEMGKDIIVLNVLRGTDKPYYLKSKGMTPDGIFVRQGATVQHATKGIIKQMIIESSGLSFEKNISNNQDLTFDYADSTFKGKGILFKESQKTFLGLINKDGKFTNLGLLLSDQCPYSIKIARYKDNTKSEFIDSKEFGNESILKQLEDVYEYLMLNNNVKGTFNGLERIDTYDYPEKALREILCNVITHRDYEINGSNLIHIYNNKIEFLSLGGLVGGLTIDDIKLGTSSPRNPELVQIFHRLNYVEACGTGIPRVYEQYANSLVKPEIKIAPNTFLVTLPKICIKNEYNIIMNYLKENEEGTREEFEKLLNLEKSATINVLNEMLEKEMIIKVGDSKNTTYRLK